MHPVTKYLPCKLILLFYALAAYVTGLNWIPFRDEGLYLAFARKLSSEWPTMRVMHGVNGIGNLINMVIVRTVGDNIVIFRVVTVGFAVACIYLACDVSGCFRAAKRWKYTFIVASLPMFFIYSFQVNGFIIGIFFALLIMKLYLGRYEDPGRAENRGSWTVSAGLFLACTGAVFTNPFLLAYPLTIVVSEAVRMIKVRRVGSVERRIFVSCLLPIVLFALLWGMSSAKTSVHPAHHLIGNAGASHNPRFFGLYLGHIPVLLIFLGGMFPFLLFSFRKRINPLIFVFILTAVLSVSARVMPATLTVHQRFHCIFLKMGDVICRWFDFPVASLETIVAVLIGFGLYNLVNVLYQSPKDGVFFFSVCTGSVYLTMILVFSDITARLLLPGMLGIVFMTCRVYEERPVMMRFQMVYQVVITALYVYALYVKRGFFGIGPM